MQVTCDHCGKQFTTGFSYFDPVVHRAWCADCCIKDEDLLTKYGFSLPPRSMLLQFGGNYWSGESLQRIPKRIIMVSGTNKDPICDHCGTSFPMNTSMYDPNIGHVAWCALCVVEERKELEAVGIAVLCDDTEVRSKGGEWWNVSAPTIKGIPKRRPICRFAYYGTRDCDCPHCQRVMRGSPRNTNPFGY